VHLLISLCLRAFAGTEEEIFSTGKIYHAGQSIGMIIAETSVIAR